jgi:FkbM family methyltransferase
MATVSLEHLLYGFKNQYAQDEEIKFFGHCLTALDYTRSQNFQDIWALYENKFKRDGFFVEFGATNGIDGSNTFILEKYYGWKGILAEPNPVWHQDLIRNRSATIVTDCVYTETGNTLEFINAPDPTLSTIKGFGENDEHSHIRMNGDTFTVNTISLGDLLSAAPREIDYLSIDTEGSEYSILESYFGEHSTEHVIKCITVEHNNDVELRTQIYNLLAKYNYERKFTVFSRWDDYFILKGV